MIDDPIIRSAIEEIYCKPGFARHIRPKIEKQAAINDVKFNRSDYIHLLSQYYCEKKYSGVLNVSDIKILTWPSINSTTNCSEIMPESDITYPEFTCLSDKIPEAISRLINKEDRRPAISLFHSRKQNSSRHAYSFSLPFGIPIICDNEYRPRIIRELSSREYDALHVRGGSKLIQDPDFFIENCVFIHDDFVGQNYCHWLLDWVPRLVLFKKSGVPIEKVNFLMPRRLSKFQEETFGLFGVASTQIIQMAHRTDGKAACVGMSEFWCLSTTSGGWRHALHRGASWASESVRSIFLGAPEHAPGRRLILDRKGSRRMIFDGEAKYLLEKYGFEIVFCEGMSVKEQAKMFSNAEAIIAVHGAGLANLVFCQPNTRVFEVFPPNHSTDAFFHVSLACGLRYHCAVGDVAYKVAGAKPHEVDVLISGEVVSAWVADW